MFLEKLRAGFVKGGVVALDVPQVAGGADYVLPGCALGSQQAGNVLVGPYGLRPEIAFMNGLAVLINAGRAGDQEDGDSLDVQPQPARERRRLGVIEGLVQHGVVGDGLLGDNFRFLLDWFNG